MLLEASLRRSTFQQAACWFVLKWHEHHASKTKPQHSQYTQYANGHWVRVQRWTRPTAEGRCLRLGQPSVWPEQRVSWSECETPSSTLCSCIYKSKKKKKPAQTVNAVDEREGPNTKDNFWILCDVDSLWDFKLLFLNPISIKNWTWAEEKLHIYRLTIV